MSVSARVGASGSVSASVGASGSVEGVGGVESDPKAARKGSLVEFEKDRGKTGLGVIVGTQGKKNWLVMDQVRVFRTHPQPCTRPLTQSYWHLHCTHTHTPIHTHTRTCTHTSRYS